MNTIDTTTTTTITTPWKVEERDRPVRSAKSKRLSQDDIEVVAALEAVRSDMEFLHNCFDETTEPILVDSLIYEIKAANLRYQYYIGKCKEKGIVCGEIPELRR